MARKTTTTAVETAAPAGAAPVMPLEKARTELAELSRGLVDTGEAIIAAVDPDDEASIDRCELFLTSRIQPARKRLKAVFDPICDLTHKAWKAATGTRAELDEPLAKLEEEAKQASVDARNEINRRIEADRLAREAEARRAQEEAAAREAEELREAAEAQRLQAEREAAELAAAGKEAEAAAVITKAEQTAQHVEAVADAVVEEAKTAPPPVLPARAPSKPIGGVSYSTRFFAEVTDIKALCRAVAEGVAPEDAVVPNMAKLNGMAEAMKTALRVPGVVAKSRQVVAGRARM